MIHIPPLDQESAIKDSHIWIDCTSNDACYIVEDPYCTVSHHVYLSNHSNEWHFVGEQEAIPQKA